MKRTSSFELRNVNFIQASDIMAMGRGYADTVDDVPEVIKTSRRDFDSKRSKDRRRQENRENSRYNGWN